MLKTYETWMPDFPGFHETRYTFRFDDIEWMLFDAPETDVAGQHLSWILENIHDYVDYCAYENAIATEYVKQWLLVCKNNARLDYVKTIEFDGIKSPQAYNFSNDSINIRVKLDLAKLVKDFRAMPDVAKHIEETNTSYDDFSSNFENDVDEWLATLESGLEHKVGAMLEYVADLAIDDEVELYHDVMGELATMEFIDFETLIKDFNVEFSMSIKSFNELESGV